MQPSQLGMSEAEEVPQSQLHRHQRFNVNVQSHESHMSQLQTPYQQGPSASVMSSADQLSNSMQGMHIHSSANARSSSHLAPMAPLFHAPPIQHSMMDPLENLLGPFPCVRLRNMPYDANIEDVLLFFQGLMILDVVILPPPVFSGQHQLRTAEAFVLFANPSDFQMAFQRNRQLMRHEGAPVDIFQGKRHDYYAAVSSVRSMCTCIFVLHPCICMSVLCCSNIVLLAIHAYSASSTTTSAETTTTTAPWGCSKVSLSVWTGSCFCSKLESNIVHAFTSAFSSHHEHASTGTTSDPFYIRNYNIQDKTCTE
jgi:hypothetical protein